MFGKKLKNELKQLQERVYELECKTRPLSERSNGFFARAAGMRAYEPGITDRLDAIEAHLAIEMKRECATAPKWRATMAKAEDNEAISKLTPNA